MIFKLIYVSPNGTTRTTSEILKDEIAGDGHIIELIDIGKSSYREDLNAVVEKLDEADVVGFGSPAYHMDMLEPMTRLLSKLLSTGNGYSFKAFLYINYASITSGKAFLNTAKMLDKAQIPVIGAMKVTAPHFHHIEKFPSDTTKEFIQSFYHEMKDKNFAPISKKRLFNILSPQKLRVNIIYPLIHLVGKKRELKITIRAEKCKGCGKCVNECPAAAISLNYHAIIDFSKCIHCYHCTITCKLKAVEAPVEKLDDMIKVNKKVIGMERPPNQIYI